MSGFEIVKKYLQNRTDSFYQYNGSISRITTATASNGEWISAGYWVLYATTSNLEGVMAQSIIFGFWGWEFNEPWKLQLRQYDFLQLIGPSIQRFLDLGSQGLRRTPKNGPVGKL
jgi:hypothetical protein